MGGGGGEDPSTRKVLESGTTFLCVYKEKSGSVWLPSRKGIKEDPSRPASHGGGLN